MTERAKKEGISRRAALAGLGAVAIGCGGASEGPIETAAPEITPPASTSPPPTEPPPPPPPPPEPPQLTPKDLLAGIEHIVVVVMENRSFDHFLGALRTDPAYAAKAQVDGLTGAETNPAPDGSAVGVFKMTNFEPKDPPHGWDAAHAQFNEGKNDGFVLEHAGDSQEEVMGFHDRSQIPFYYWLADNFAVCDRWFCSVLGPTWPNRFFIHAATSAGKTNNTPIVLNPPRTIWDELEDAGVTALNYTAAPAAWVVGGFFGRYANRQRPIAEFFTSVQAGTLPAFSLIDPDYLSSDDHPDHNIQRGQAFVASIYQALAQSSLWTKTLLIVTYDEHGGFFDHVPPPKTVDERPDFEQLGFRVPAFVVGARVKKGYVCKTTLEHVSIAATLRTRFGIKDLNARMAATNDISDCIDPVKVKAPSVPPMGMPQVAMTLEAALHEQVGHSSQPDLDALVASGVVPTVNPASHAQRIGSWLEHAVRVGAIRIVGG